MLFKFFIWLLKFLIWEILYSTRGFLASGEEGSVCWVHTSHDGSRAALWTRRRFSSSPQTPRLPTVSHPRGSSHLPQWSAPMSNSSLLTDIEPGPASLSPGSTLVLTLESFVRPRKPDSHPPYHVWTSRVYSSWSWVLGELWGWTARSQWPAQLCLSFQPPPSWAWGSWVSPASAAQPVPAANLRQEKDTD